MVEDLDSAGTVISDDVLGKHNETIFPLQVALGYQMAQGICLSPHVLMVKHPTDAIYLQALGEAAAAAGGTRLDPRWTVLPVGGAENVPTFVSLLGENHLTVAVLMDDVPESSANGNGSSAKRGPASKADNVSWINVNRSREGEVEDLMEIESYLAIVNGAYGEEVGDRITRSAIADPATTKVTQRLSAYFAREGISDGSFDRSKPATYLSAGATDLLSELDERTIDRASALFQKVNALLPAPVAASSVEEPAKTITRPRAVA